MAELWNVTHIQLFNLISHRSNLARRSEQFTGRINEVELQYTIVKKVWKWHLTGQSWLHLAFSLEPHWVYIPAQNQSRTSQEGTQDLGSTKNTMRSCRNECRNEVRGQFWAVNLECRYIYHWYSEYNRDHMNRRA